MKIKYTILAILSSLSFCFSQVKVNSNNIWTAKEFSKEISLFKSKEFLFKNVLGTSDQIVPFEVIPLAAASSGELTTLLYKCESKQKEGLILGFYGDYWNEAGVLYQGYSFKNLEKEKAIEFLNKIVSAIEENKKFLNENSDNNNICFKFDDMDILIWTNAGNFSIRIFWQGFDSTWEKTAFERSKRRFEKRIK
ncbi:hypothetical protein [Flavobacterium stagni]|uniref:Uncharacterized protein n=1 Tax=Flavobacterium stagni TaxID=2506421 RepID=A0A4Q1KCU2_9FLAO|nr:hypothetical protein [Flavobacterium stagni]RXR23049.1 hypothetical protein EQG61_07380 [Flavobacterium stagni]